MRSDCYFCHIKTLQHLIGKFKPSPEKAEEFIFAVHNEIGQNRNLNNPELATLIHRIAKEKLKVDDLYNEEKNCANKLLMSNYSYWRNFVDTSKKPVHTAVKLAVIGNIIDYGAHSVKEDIVAQIESFLQKPLKVDRTEELIEAVNAAKRILYLGDNAGEIFFDRLLIETLDHQNLTVATRAYPIINDITHYDAQQVGLDTISNIISNGYDAPSTLLKHCSDEFMEYYKGADLIISKGQGNFEGLFYENHPNTFFLFIAKCNAIAEMVGSEVNEMIVTTLKQKQECHSK